MEAVDVGLVGADHPVDMDQALVAALRLDLLRRQFGAVDKTFRIALAERDVGGGILVEQRVEEQQATRRDRRGMRHQRHFAEPARAFIGIEHLVQHLCAARRLGLDDAPLLELHRDVVDQRALIGQRLRADDMPADSAAMRRGEDFFGRDVGIADDAVPGGRGAADPFMAVGKTDREIHARPAVMQRIKPLAVQPIGALAQKRIVFLPCGDRAVPVDARGGKDRIRKFRHRHVLGDVGKHLPRPGLRSDRR